MDDVPLCPEWWPRMLWHLHFPPRRPGPGPGPVNYPPALDSMLAAMLIHSASYMMLDKSAAQQIRSVAEQNLSRTAMSLSKLHEENAQIAEELSLGQSVN
jgi:hypothetical protein